jgi:hypothetical protein
MTVNGTQNISITLDEKEIRKIAIEYLMKRLDWKPNYSVDPLTQNVVQKKVCYTSHSWDEISIIRKANIHDLTLNYIINNK